MKLSALVDRVGKTTALVIIQDSINTEFLQTLSREDLVDLYKNLPQESNLSLEIAARIEDWQDSLVQRTELYCQIPQRLPLKQRLYEEIILRAHSFNDWLEIYAASRSNSPLNEMAWTKVFSEADTFTKAQLLYEKLKPTGDRYNRQDKVIDLLNTRAQTFKDWTVLFQLHEVLHKLDEDIFERVLALAQTLEEAVILAQYVGAFKPSFYQNSTEKHFRQQVLGKMKKLAVSFDDWKNIFYFQPVRNEDRDDQLHHLMSLARTYDDWFWLLKKFTCNDRDFARISRQVNKLAVTNQEIIGYKSELIKTLPAGKKRDRLLKDIRQVEATFSQWLEIYEAYTKRQFVKEIACEKMFSLANSFEDWLELWLVMTPKDPKKPEVLKKLQETLVING